MKKHTTKFIALIILLFSFSIINAQVNNEEKPKNKQLGIRFQSLDFDNFSLQYKSGKGDTKFRFTTAVMNVNKSESETDFDNNAEYSRYGLSFIGGIEKRHKINNKTSLFHGVDLGFNISKNKSENSNDNSSNTFKTTNKSRGASLGLVLGGQYNFNDKLSLSLEIVPSLSYSKAEGKREEFWSGFEEIDESETESLNFGFTNNFAALSLSFHF